MRIEYKRNSLAEVIVKKDVIDNGYSYIEHRSDYNREVFSIPYDKIVKKLKLR